MGFYSASSSPNSPSSTTASTPLFASPTSSSTPQHGSSYNPHRSYYFGASDNNSNSTNNNFKQRRRNLRGRNGLFFNASLSGSPSLKLVPTLLRAVLLSPLLVLVLYLTFRSSGSRGGIAHNNAYSTPRNSPAMAKTYYDHGSYKSSSSSSSSQQQQQQQRADCRTGVTYYDHGVLKRDLCNQQAQPTLTEQQQLLQSTGYDANFTDGDATVLLLPPPPLSSEAVPMTTSTAGYQQSAPGLALDTTTSTIVRPRPQPKRQIANYYNPMMESTLASQTQQEADGLPLQVPVPLQQLQQQQQRVIVQPSHLKKLGDARPMQLVTSTGTNDGSTSTLLLVQQEVEEPVQQLSTSEELLVPGLQRPPIPLPSAGATVDGGEPMPPLLEAMPDPAAQMSRKQRNQQQHQGDQDSVQGGRPSTVAYYYYDPRHVRTDARTGQVVLPDIVYDHSGKPHRLSHLRAKQVWMEAGAGPSPAVQASQPLAATAGATNMSPPKGMASTTTNAELVSANRLGSTGAATTAMMVGSGSGITTTSALPQWGESTATDQSIIICTVGLMALLVGAVSARKFRKQSILSACIENEALDHHDHDHLSSSDAYYGGLHPNHHLYGAAGGGSSSYKTFEGWRGDLEKFDV